MSPHLSSTCSDSSTRHLSIIKEVAKTPDEIANSIAFNDLKQDYKDAIQCIMTLEKRVLHLEDRIIQLSFELASAKASEDLIYLKGAHSRRRSTSDVATTPPPDPTLLVSWQATQGVDFEIDDIMSASDDDDADSEGCPSPPPQKSNKKMLRRASVATGAPSHSPKSLPKTKFGARRRTTTDVSHHYQNSRLHRVSWPGVNEFDEEDDEDEGYNSPPPPHKQQPPIKKLFRRCSLSMGEHHVEVDVVPKATTNSSTQQTFTKSLSGRRIVLENTDEPSDISDSFVPRSSPHRNNNCRDEDVYSSRQLDESASSKGFDLRQLFAKQKQGRNSDDTDEEKCHDSPISTNKNKIDTSHSSRNRGGCGADGGLDESSSSKLFGQLFQRKNSRRASTTTTTVKKEKEVDPRADFNRRIAFHKERAALLKDESDRFLA